PLAAPGIIMAGILTGTTTAAEAGILACGYTLLLSLFYRTFRVSSIWNAVTDTMLITSMIMIIIGFANGMGWLLAVERVPQAIVG
ncbi:MAG: TRAP transporter large permease subunit, partial [Limnospira sp. PMC 737.11]|uniref:TRAP transporter large permease subunit n=1 Tax=Limnospira sp. PMC 737.11 TaxID=2981095 RepID=UPI0028E13CAD